MSYVSTTTLKGEELRVFLDCTDLFVVGESHYITFDTDLNLNGTWKIVEVNENESVLLERVLTKVKTHWCPGVTTIEYPKHKK